MKPATCSPKGVNPHIERKGKRHAIVLAGEHTFQAVYDQWLTHRKLSLEEGRQTSLEQIARVFKKDVFPVLRHLTIYDITRAHLLDIIGKVESAARCQWPRSSGHGLTNCSPMPRWRSRTCTTTRPRTWRSSRCRCRQLITTCSCACPSCRSCCRRCASIAAA